MPLLCGDNKSVVPRRTAFFAYFAALFAYASVKVSLVLEFEVRFLSHVSGTQPGTRLVIADMKLRGLQKIPFRISQVVVCMSQISFKLYGYTWALNIVLQHGNR